MKSALNAYFLGYGETVSIEEYGSGAALVTDVEEGYVSFDAAFFDLDTTPDGMDAARRLRSLRVQSALVFLSSTAAYAVESYDVYAAGYLLKPLRTDKLRSLLDHLRQPAARSRISLKCRGRYRYFYVDEIVWVNSDRHTVTLHLADGTSQTITEKLSVVESLLDDSRFLRSHQSFLVNMDYIVDVRDDFILETGERIPIRVRTHKQLAESYRQYFEMKKKRKR